jgi:putative ABC transport system ATP-binding protein
MKTTSVRFERVSKYYSEGGTRLNILDNVSTEFFAGKITAILGKSGSGKSTLLNLISGIDSPSSGQVWVDNTPVTHLSEYERTVFRRNHIGIIFQFFNLIPTLTVLENVTLPRELNGFSKNDSKKKAMSLLKRVGLETRYKVFPDLLSGGEQQRVAIARALANDPDLLLADEPTGNLDIETGRQVMHLLLELTRNEGKTMIVATHSADIISLADEVYKIENSNLVKLAAQSEPLSLEVEG